MVNTSVSSPAPREEHFLAENLGPCVSVTVACAKDTTLATVTSAALSQGCLLFSCQYFVTQPKRKICSNTGSFLFMLLSY